MDKQILNFLSKGYEEEWILLYLIKHKLIESNQIDRMTESIKRLSQSTFREKIIIRDKKCIISEESPIVCQAAHIVPYSECKSFNPENGLLLNACLHILFDKYLFSINPDTLMIHILDTNTDLSINKYQNKIINVHPSCIPYLKLHFNKFISQK